MEAGQELPVDVPPPPPLRPLRSSRQNMGQVGLKRYVREQETLPVQPPAAREQTEGEEMFSELASAIEKLPKREWEENA